MAPSDQLATREESTPAIPFRNRPFRFKLGIGLLILYPLMWLFAAVVPFLPLAVGMKAAIIGGDLVAAEIIFFLGVACVGKETYQAIKAKFRRKNRKKAAASNGS